jgi:ATP/maltotriose-dependent transcriptional regulator MalT
MGYPLCAGRLFRQVHGAIEQLRFGFQRGGTLVELGKALVECGFASEGKAALQQAQAIYEADPSGLFLRPLFAMLVAAKAKLGQHQEAARLALSYSHEETRTETLHVVGMVLARQEGWEAASAFLREHFPLWEDENHRRIVANVGLILLERYSTPEEQEIVMKGLGWNRTP